MISLDLNGRLAVVTGARRGIGLACAEGLAAAGADIVGVSARLEPSGSEVQRRVEAHGRRFVPVRADLADEVALRRLAERLASETEPVDILVNNAGTIVRAPAIDHPDSAWDQVLAINVSAQFRLARAAGSAMVPRGAGKIVFIASLLSFQGGINVPSYAASKHAVLGVTRALANEWASSGVNVNAVAPGYIATDNTRPLQEDADRSRAILERIPAGRWGRPEDVVGAVVYLAAPASDYVHGAVLAVDGGWLSR